MSIALIHDWLTNTAGAEKVLLQMKKLYPDADIFTSVYDPLVAKAFNKYEIQTTYLQKYKIFRKRREALIPFAPLAFEALDLSKYDMIITNTTFPAKGVITKPDTLHICYCHTPTRYLWEPELDSRADKGFMSGLRKKTAHNLRIWDIVASQRPDYYLANSETVKQRIQKYYKRDARVVYPPVDIKKFTTDKVSKIQDYYLFVSRLIDYKRADIVIEAFNKLGKPLKIIGGGPEEQKLKSLANDNVEFLGKLDDEQLVKYYQEAYAFIFAAEEDFGIVPVEAMACGRPVIAFGKGGACETVVDGETGTYFKEQTPQSLIQAVESFDANKYNRDKIRARAEKFSEDNFKNNFLDAIDQIMQDWEEKNKH